MKKVDLPQPTLLLAPFCSEGNKNSIPYENTDSSNPQKADLKNGFPTKTQGSPDDGKLPPERADFNGLGNLTTTYDFFYQAGGTFTFSQTISTAIGGYPLGARLWHTNSGGQSMILRSTKDDNTDDFTQDESYIGSSWVIESMVGIDNASINLLDYKFSDKLINKMSWVLSNGSWLSGYTYTNAFTHLKEDVAFMPTNTPSIVVGSNSKFSSGTYTRSSSDDKVILGVSYYAWNNGTDTFYVLVDIDAMSGADAFVALQGQSIFEYDSDSTNMYLTIHKIVKIEKETVGNIDLYVWIGSDGHRIVDVMGGTDQDTAVSTLYSQIGIAWYYVLDVANNRFKLPQTKWNFVGSRGNVGKFVKEGLPNIIGKIDASALPSSAEAFGEIPNVDELDIDGAFEGIFGGQGSTVESGGSEQLRGFSFDASKSNNIYGASTTVQQKATEMYLYFYVGGFNDTAITQTAGINADTINNKLDIDALNASSAGKNEVVSWGRQFTSVGSTIASGTISIAGTYDLGFTDNKIKMGLFKVSLQLSGAGGSKISLGTDIVSDEVCVATNNGYQAISLVWLPFITEITIGFPEYTGGIISPTGVDFVGYM